jgi:hypothetical protein
VRIPRLFACVAILAAFSASLIAQQPQTGYHTVACFKVKPENAAEFRKFAVDEAHKLAQGRVDDGEITTWYLLRAVLPQGSSSECDYISVAMFPGTPHLLGPDNTAAALKKSGLSISPEDYTKHRNAVSTLVSVAVFQNQLFVGTAKKGDYFLVNYMKVPGSIDEWVAYEKKVWQPIAESLTKDGVTDGWSLNVQVLPRGSDLPYQAVTVDVFSSWDAIYTGFAQLGDRFKKVHPDMELGTTFEQFEKLRTILSTKTFVLEDMISAAK